MLPVALTIAGSDPSGGAGLQADLKTFHQFGVYGASAITLVTVQNTAGVSRVEVLEPLLVREQVEAVLSDLPVRAIKIGALGNAALVRAVSELLRHTENIPVVLDPVMISKHGAPLLSDEAQTVLRNELLPHVYLVTPNLPEAEALAGTAEPEAAARAIRDMGCRNVLVKGGHSAGEPVDLLLGENGVQWFRGQRIETRHTHGTGCTLAAAITAGLAHGRPLSNAVGEAKAFVQLAIETAPGLGHGFGPLNHFAATK